MKKTLLSLAFSLCCIAAASAQVNLIENGDFSNNTDPLKGWRVDFPYEGWYVKNVTYVKVDQTKTSLPSRAVAITMPEGVGGNEGAKIESAFIKAEPGATYRAQIDCMTNEVDGKLFAECWALDPAPTDKPDKWRIPARNGMPPLVTCYRADFPDPPANSNKWTTMTREFKIPMQVIVQGKPEPPLFITLKAFEFSGAKGVRTGYFTKFKLMKIH